MSDHLDTNGVFINSIIGEGTSFSGDILLSGLIRIDGDFKGSITTTGKVLIGKNGRAECTIKAETVVIGGVVKGDIISEDKVVILSTGMLIGNIVSPRLIAEEGVEGLDVVSHVSSLIADGIIRLGVEKIAGNEIRTLQIVKMRRTRHPLERVVLVLKDDGLDVMNAEEYFK